MTAAGRPICWSSADGVRLRGAAPASTSFWWTSSRTPTHLQCEIVRSLALIGDEDERPGLFIVGDPKQSIYGWRDADLAAYDRFKGEVQAAGGLVCQLVQNFRSTQVILDEVARMVEPVMVRRIGIQPDFPAPRGHRRAPQRPRF